METSNGPVLLMVADEARSKRGCATTLLDLPIEVLRQCDLTPKTSSHTAIDVRWMTLCRSLLCDILTTLEPSLNLRLGSPQQSSSSWRSLLHLTQAFDELHRVNVTINTGPVESQLAALLATPLAIRGSGKARLANITHLSIQGNWQGASVVSPLLELVPGCVAASCPSLRAFCLTAVHIASQKQPDKPHARYHRLHHHQHQHQHQQVMMTEPEPSPPAPPSGPQTPPEHQKQQENQPPVTADQETQRQAEEEATQPFMTGTPDCLLEEFVGPQPRDVVPVELQPHYEQQQQQQPGAWLCQSRYQAASQLSQLTLKSCLIDVVPDKFQHQLQNFRSLKTLTVDCCMFTQFEESRFYIAIADALSKQLIEFNSGVSELSPHAVTALLSAEYPVLRKLTMPRTVVGDGTMELLLQYFPCLTDLSVQRFQLKSNYARRACPWLHVALAHVDVASLAHLPTVREMFVKLIGTSCQFHLVSLGLGAQADLQRTAEAVANMGRFGGLLHIAGNVVIDIDFTAPPHTEQVLIESVPLLRYVTAATFHGVKVVHTLLRALGMCPSLRAVSFSMRCAFGPGACCAMVPLLPQVQRRSIDAEHPTITTNVRLADIIALCASANHAVRLVLKSEQFRAVNKAWLQRLHQALSALNHNFVTLDINYSVLPISDK